MTVHLVPRTSAAALVVLSLLTLATTGRRPSEIPLGTLEMGPLGELNLGLRLGVVNGVLLLFVAMVGLVVTTYSARNLVGQRRLARYALLETAVLTGLALVVTSTSLPVLAVGWTASSLAIAGLVAHADTPQARTAARLVRERLLVGDAFLWAAVVWTWFGVGTWQIADAARLLADSPVTATCVALLLTAAGAVRSALVPAHRWLPETAEAPSPVSALLHAGVVNGVGILALTLWPMLTSSTLARMVLAAMGIASVLVATAQSRTRPDVKSRLAASTSSQMGYLALQVALAVPAAVLLHVVGHGVWKASQFLGAGGAVDRARKTAPTSKRAVGPMTAIGAVAFAAGLVGALAAVPIGTLPALLAPGEILALVVAAAVLALGLAALVRADAPNGSRALAAAAAVGVAVTYVIGLRALTLVLETPLGVPTPWGASGSLLALTLVAIALAAGALLTAVDTLASRGQIPGLVRWAATSALRPLTLRERVGSRPRVAVAVPQMRAEQGEAARAAVHVATASVGPLYPLTGFVATNPLSGLENIAFTDAFSLVEDAWDAAPGHGSRALATALAEGRATEEDLTGVIDGLVPAGYPELLRLSGVRVSTRLLVRSVLIADTVGDEARFAASQALERAGFEPERRVLTPAEAVFGAGDIEHMTRSSRARELSHHLCLRTLAGSTWPGLRDPWAELRGATYLDAALCVRGAHALVAELPADPALAISALLDHLEVDPHDRTLLLTRLLARDPGWVAHLMWRARHARLGQEAGLDTTDASAEELIVSLAAVRLTLDVLVSEAARTGRPVLSAGQPRAARSHGQAAAAIGQVSRYGVDPSRLTVAEVRTLHALLEPLTEGRLAAARSEVLERAWRRSLLQLLPSPPGATKALGTTCPAPAPAQLVTCIDVRSERLRRHLELNGPWETFGTAGFFGLPLRHVDALGRVTERTPALVRPSATVTELPPATRAPHGTANALRHAAASIASAPGLVLGWAEIAGVLAAPWVALTTLAPASAKALSDVLTAHLGRPRAGRVDPVDSIGLAATVEAAEAFLRTTGLTHTAPLVVIAGHGAGVPNNPHVAAYECGACGGSPGDVSARVMVAALNDDRVRGQLELRGLAIPAETRFVAALHDTTRDEVSLLDTDELPASHLAYLTRLAADLERACAATRAERAGLLPGGSRALAGPGLRRAIRSLAADWASPRPEWGLAGAAAIVVGPRRLTRALDLQGRVFLQSYEPATDPDGRVLEQLLAAPVVVAQWITAQYWASVVDPARFGAGDKTTHNVVSGPHLSAVLTGPRGDLRLGLPWQAISTHAPAPIGGQAGLAAGDFHEPLRLLALVNATPDVIDAALVRQPSVARLVSGGWITMCAVDPEDGRAWRRTAWSEWLAERDELGDQGTIELAG